MWLGIATIRLDVGQGLSRAGWTGVDRGDELGLGLLSLATAQQHQRKIGQCKSHTASDRVKRSSQRLHNRFIGIDQPGS